MPRATTKRSAALGLGVLTALLTVLAVLAPAASAQVDYNGTGGNSPSGIYVCIESDAVLSAPASAGLSVGNTFVGADYQTYVITTGGPTCSLDSAGCTGNMYLVDDVKACVTGTPAVTTVDASAAAPAAIQVGVLAHTGEEHELAGAFAASLVGAGFAALAITRSVARRED